MIVIKKLLGTKKEIEEALNEIKTLISYNRPNIRYALTVEIVGEKVEVVTVLKATQRGVVKDTLVQKQLMKNEITRAELAVRWNLSPSSVTKHIKEGDIRSFKGKVYLDQVEKHEELFASPHYIEYDKLSLLLQEGYSQSRTTLSTACRINKYKKPWIMGKKMILATDAKAVIAKYESSDPQLIINHLNNGD